MSVARQSRFPGRRKSVRGEKSAQGSGLGFATLQGDRACETVDLDVTMPVLSPEDFRHIYP
mgnify:CR=1 FL=1